MALVKLAPDAPQQRAGNTATRRLLAAVLQRALDDATGPARRGSTACTPADRSDALSWIGDDGIAPMSFRWLCAALEIEPEAVRRRVRRVEPTAAIPPTLDSACGQRETA